MNSPAAKSGAGKWMALTAALLGWLFDGAEMGLFSLVGRPAIRELLGMTGTPTAAETQKVAFLFSVITAMFLVGAATGGVLFGWLGDRIGRVRAMSLSVITYALFTGLCGFATSAWQIAILRFIAALGMGGEWSLGVALVMEVWPNRSRALMAGLIGAAANVGYLLVGFLGLVMDQVPGTIKNWLLTVGVSATQADSLVGNGAWRLLMIMGVAPALLTFLFRIFVPESEKWEQEQQSGATSHWATRDLMGVLIGAIGPAVIIFVCAMEFPLWIRLVGSLFGVIVASVGYLYPVVQYLKRSCGVSEASTAQRRTIIGRMLLAACLSGIALLGTWGSTQQTPSWAAEIAKPGVPDASGEKPTLSWTAQIASSNGPTAAGTTLIALSLGAITGTIGGALIGGWLGRRITYCLLCLSSLASVWMWTNSCNVYGIEFLVYAFVAGTCTASFYGWLPLYLPELFGTNVRATGQGFGFNFGRILASVGTLQITALKGLFTGDITMLGLTFPKGYPALLSTISMIYLLGAVIIWFAPETKGQPLPD